jgi:diguanylate cyclase
MRDSAADRVLVRSTIELAHALDLEAVAEGVEDAETLDQLAAFGCDYVQGYFVSRPLAADALFQKYAGGRALAA